MILGVHASAGILILFELCLIFSSLQQELGLPRFGGEVGTVERMVWRASWETLTSGAPEPWLAPGERASLRRHTRARSSTEGQWEGGEELLRCLTTYLSGSPALYEVLHGGELSHPKGQPRAATAHRPRWRRAWHCGKCSSQLGPAWSACTQWSRSGSTLVRGVPLPAGLAASRNQSAHRGRKRRSKEQVWKPGLRIIKVILAPGSERRFIRTPRSRFCS